MSASSLVLVSLIENANALMLHLSAADYEGFNSHDSEILCLFVIRRWIPAICDC